jgi:uncharacterized protein
VSPAPASSCVACWPTDGRSDAARRGDDLQRCGDVAAERLHANRDIADQETPVTLPPLLLEVIVCPECKSTLTVDEESSELVCDDCGLIYPIRDGIPILLISAARRPDGHAGTDGDDNEADAVDGADAADDTVDVEASDDDAAVAQPTDD